jgi:TatD DNase family protein
VFDAHNHLQDDRLAGRMEQVMFAARQAGVRGMVVNGSCEEDWGGVIALARRFPEVIPSLGYHPWHVRTRAPAWRERLQTALAQSPRPAGIGEIGLDRWIKGFDLPDQEEVFLWQLDFAARHNLPASIHCLNAWGRLHDLLRSHPLPKCGFLLHSYGGPAEMIEPLARLGAYFSLPGYFAHARKERQRDTFKQIPADRLLIETDAPDQLLPPERDSHQLADPTGRIINHPANLAAVYRFASELLCEPLPELQVRVAKNFHRLFEPLVQQAAETASGTE